MTERRSACPPDDLLIELALGHLDGRQRCDALAHVTGCDECSQQIRAWLDVSEQVLLAAPASEPPLGFESAVLRRVRQPRRGRRRLLLAAAAALILIALTAASLLVVVGRSSEAVVEARMITPSGRDVGEAWIYDDDVSWIFVSVPGWKVWERPDGSTPNYRLEATLDDGSTVDMGSVTFNGDDEIGRAHV